MYDRLLKIPVNKALKNAPVILVQGPRQSGKTTFVRQFESKGYHFATMDNIDTLDFAKKDPVGFIRGKQRLIIDEIQKVPEIFSQIKLSVDEDRQPGRFILTGSANVLLLPDLSDSLAGRMRIMNMLPLSRAEISGRKPSFLKNLFESGFRSTPDEVIDDNLMRILIGGGFPEVVAMNDEESQMEWMHSYIQTIVQRDMRDIATINNLIDLSNFIAALATNSAQLVNYSKIGRDVRINYHTVQRYAALLEQLFIVSRLQPWHSNKRKQFVKSPKLHFLDSGLLACSLNMSVDYLRMNRQSLGCLLETFVFSEVMKLVGTSDYRIKPYFYRNDLSREVDIVLVRSDGRIAGIEVKASATVRIKDLAGLKSLAENCGEQFAFGVVLYNGTTVKSMGERFAAAPVSSLWA